MMKTKWLLMMLAAAMFAVGNVALGDIVTRSIQDENDDAEEYLTAYYATASYTLGAGWLISSDLELGNEFNELCWTGIGLQYDQLGIPTGSLITSAKLTFTVDEAQVTSSSNDFTIFGEAAGNASPFNYITADYNPLVPFDITSRVRTSASAAWSHTDPAVGLTIDTPDLTTIIQEIVNQGGWSANNRLTLTIFPDAYLDSMPLTTGVTRHVYEGGPGTDSATLTVEFISGKKFFATNPAPYIGETVGTGDVELSWDNADPNFSGHSVYVDVWFGEPNQAGGIKFTKVVDAGENTTSVTVDASDPNTYYWRVDSYRYGSPIGDPCEGSVWRFNSVADIPPSVDAGADMITWSGKAVPLNPTVVDDGESALTILWTAFPADGVSWPDGANVVDPNVTIDKSGLLTTLLLNPGFESPDLNDGGYVGTGGVPGWTEGYYDVTYPGEWIVAPWSAGVINPDAAYGYGGNAAEGENVAYAASYVGYDMGLSQILSVALQANTQYVLSAKVGNPYAYNGGTTADYRIELVAGSTEPKTLLASDTGPSPNGTTDPNWFDVSLTHNSGSVSDPNVGQTLEIRLMTVDNGLTGDEVNFDDVKLTATPAYPFPAVHTVTLTLAVNDELNTTPVKDTMEIDVYDTACLATRIGLSLPDPTDFDENCITDLKDLAAMLAVWLKDTGLTAPAAK